MTTIDMPNDVRYDDKTQLWWPTYEQRAAKSHHFVMSRLKDVDLAIRRCPQKLAVVQAGGHIGLWPRRLATYFSRVYTFEPDPTLCEALRRNCEGFPAIRVHEQALGATVADVKMRPHINSGGWRVSDDGTVPVKQVTIDSLQLDACDLIVLDVEAYEVEAMKGAVKTINKFRPVIMVEQLPRSELAIYKHLCGLRYAHNAKSHSDHVWIPLR